ncbi:hypothetical protein ACJIZ3_020020 [Penstemon smallii]|uniref:RNA-directed RNA polymerase n=1 Tax=Penstemon smallii TaxID=265156 RepID=A0ABD3SHT7_9LAMI
MIVRITNLAKFVIYKFKLNLVHMGKTLRLSGFPCLPSADAVKSFLEQHTGPGTVVALEVKPSKRGSRPYARVQFINSICADIIVRKASTRLYYGTSYLKAWEMGIDIVQNPISHEHQMERVTLNFGCQISEDKFSVLWKGTNVSIKFGTGLKKMFFVLSCNSVEYKLQLSYQNIWQIVLYSPHRRSAKILLIQLFGAPRIYKKLSESIYSFYQETHDDQWVRTTDFTPSCIGQSSGLALQLPHGMKIPNFRDNFVYYKESENPLDLMKGKTFSNNLTLVPILHPPGFLDNLPYRIIFQICRLVQTGCIPGPRVDTLFYQYVNPNRIDSRYIDHALEKLYYLKECCYDPVGWLHEQYDKYRTSREKSKSSAISLDKGLVYVHRVQVTPTKVYFSGPEVNLSNRVLRHYKDDIDNFLRVSFVDEEWDKLYSTDLSPRGAVEQTKVFERILETLRGGIKIGNKKFDFLAFSSSQLRENSLWMFASTPTRNSNDIRRWMGDFKKIRNVAKYAARLGQSFGSSTETLSVSKHEIEDIPDVEVLRNGTKYVFSDGIGKISAEFASIVAAKCRVKRFIPSAFQIRYGGYKGVVAIDPSSSKKLSLRPSMLKYDSDNTKLDVLSWSKYQPCFLNRQIITLLSSLGVKDHIFEKKQRKAVAQLDAILGDPSRAEDALDLMSPGENTNVLKEILKCGYRPNEEPFLSMMLQTFRSSKLLDLRLKARIFIPKARQMMGCLDETGTLEYGQVFVQFSGAGNRRPHPNECSGSDLDGDIYFVCWDTDLIPPKQTPPMDYNPAPSTQLDHDVTIEEVEEYFTNYIVNDSLGIISNAHTAFADKETKMAFSKPCIELANLFSIAVDFPKTGIPAEIPPHLRVKEYPDFMEKPDKTTYESQRVIGKLFREVKLIAPHTVSFNPFTKDVARKSYDPDMEVDGFEDYIDEAFDCKTEYDYKLGNLMEYYGIKTEAEILSGDIMRMSKTFDLRKNAEAIGAAVRSLRNEARSWFKSDDVYEKASAWYHVTYHHEYWGCYNKDLKRDHYISFPWCVYDKLVQIKKNNSTRARNVSLLGREFSRRLSLSFVCLNFVHMGKTIRLSGFPYLVSADAVKSLLERHTGLGTVVALEVKPSKRGTRPYARVQFISTRCADIIIRLANTGLYYGTSYLKAWEMDIDIVQNPRSQEHQMEQVTLNLGCQISEDKFSVLWKGTNVSVKFGTGMKKMFFVLSCNSVEYKLQLSYQNIWQIVLYSPHRRFAKILLIQLFGAPRIYKKLSESIYSFYQETHDDQWVRTTDFTPSCIGQSSGLALQLPHGMKIPNFRDNFVYYKESENPLDLVEGKAFSNNPTLVPILHPPGSLDNLPYRIIFQICRLVQTGCIPGPRVDALFYQYVNPNRIDSRYIDHALEKLYYLRECCYNPVVWLHEQYDKYRTLREKPNSPAISLDEGLVYVHRVQVTPTKVYFSGPEVNVSNRVLRHYKEDIDNFLRVSFVDEEWDKLYSTDLSPRGAVERTKVFERILETLRGGIKIGNKKFDFLAFSSSQLRENSLWMFASTPTRNSNDIRRWMGDFKSIRNVAKYAARLGQSFGSSTETLSVSKHEIENIPDVEVVRNGTRYIFSDGIGKISGEFARIVAAKCGVKRFIPSAFQIRYGGYKGVVAIDPSSSMKLSLRPSMLKYASDNTKLDVLSWSKYQPCFLNRQIITLLSSLGIKDHIFEKKQREAVAQLDAILEDPSRAEDALDLMSPGENANVLKEILKCGYRPNEEPFLSMMLQTFRSSKLLDLRLKARIFIPKARQMMGCLDETGTLQYGQVFVQFSGAGNRRPHPNECSGSDLDGDIYFVCWDTDLIPPNQTPPMDYNPAPSTQLDHDVTIEEVEEYFTNYIVNDSLGIISNAHTAFADKEIKMAFSEPCIELANLFSIAVDFPKTGIPAGIPPHLRVKEYPDFMEKPDKTTYESQRVIGKLFREVKSIAPHTVSFNSFTEDVARKSYDPDMEVDGFEDYIDEAFDFKTEYDYKLGNLMEYYGIKTEAEILSGGIMRMSKTFDRRKDAEAIGAAVRSLRNEARSWFKRGGESDDVYEKASAWYHVTYHHEYWGCYNKDLKRDHYISFPWCVYDKLVQIKKKNSRRARNVSLLGREFSRHLSLR